MLGKPVASDNVEKEQEGKVEGASSFFLIHTFRFPAVKRKLPLLKLRLQAPPMGTAKATPGALARRPDNSAFKQQKLPAWSPMLSANTVLPFFYLVALLCMLLGVWLLVTVQSIQEMKVGECVCV